MFGKRKQARHSIRLGVFVAGCITLFCIHVTMQPKVTQVLYALHGNEEKFEAKLPLLVEGIPKEPFTVWVTMDMPVIHPFLLFITPDDCIDSLNINNQQFRTTQFPYCNAEQGRRVNMFRYINAGENTFVLHMRNQGWPGGVDLSVHWMDPTNLIPLLLFIGLLYWYTSAYWNIGRKKGIKAFVQSFSKKERQQCLLFFKVTTAVLFTTGMMVGFWYLIERAGYELKNPYTADLSIYVAVGRGILNGLTPYVDLFENKPPGIFLLAAASLWMFNDSTFMHIVQAAILLGFFYIFGIWFIARELQSSLKDLLTSRNALLGSATIFFGIAIAMYTALRSGEAQVESFGAFFGFLYLLVIASHKKHISFRIASIAGLLLMLSVGFKEPFLLTALAGAILITHGHWRKLWRAFAVPAVVAGVVGVLALLILGYLEPYITIYLREMMGHHIPNGSPLWMRGLEWKMVWNDMKDFSPYFAWGIVLMAISYLFHRWKEKRNPLTVVLQIYAVLVVVYLLNIAIGMGGAYFNHHFVFGMPVYIGFFLVFLEDAKTFWKDKGTRCIALAVAFMLCFSMFAHTRVPYAHFLGIFEEESKTPKDVAIVIDNILDNCEIDTYVFLGGNGPRPFRYTRHSPAGPLFVQYYYSLSASRSWFRQEFRETLKDAQVVVVYKYVLNGMHQEVASYIEENFSEEAWGCAKASMNNKVMWRYKILFRTSR